MKSNSQYYIPWIQVATFLAIIIICYVFYKTMITYLEWKNENLPKESFNTNKGCGIVSMMKNPKNIDTWLQKHRDLGIKHFYIRLEQTPDVEEYLGNQHDVTLQIGKSKGVNEYEEIQERQNIWVNEALRKAEKDNDVNWLFHIDADEILKGDLNKVQELPDSVRTFWFQNEEAKFDKVPQKTDSCFSASTLTDCSKEPKNCVSYGNGKGCGRVAPDVLANGPHRMKSTKKENTDEKVDVIKLEHYESCDFDIFKEKFKHLAVQDKKSTIPFAYYNESINAAKDDDDNALYKIYEKYRVS